MRIHSFNEYDPLKTVIVGSATNANFPVHDKLFQQSMKFAGWKDTPPPVGCVSKKIIEETNEDLEVLANALSGLGIKVLRPDVIDFSKTVRTLDWSSDGQYAYCPRDTLLVLGDQVIEAPMSTRARQHEVLAFDSIRRAAIESGMRWWAAPRPRLLDTENYVKSSKFHLTNCEPAFDAANIARFGYDLLYLVSSTGNRAGAYWLQNMLPDYRVHVTDVYDAAHIDSTIVPIEYNWLVLNGERVNDDNLPAFLKDHSKIYITEDMINPQGFEGYPYASKWIAINMLALGNFTVVVDKNQDAIIKELEKKNFTVIPLELRHARTLGGGFHCVTLDLERDPGY
jgi:N-dimethylarginine dimethylaminohydrolase